MVAIAKVHAKGVARVLVKDHVQVDARQGVLVVVNQDAILVVKVHARAVVMEAVKSHVIVHAKVVARQAV